MALSRTILAVLIVIIGVMMDNVYTATTNLKQEIIHLSDRIDSLPQPMVLQSSMMRIGKARVAPVKHFYKRPQTIIDPLCKQ